MLRVRTILAASAPNLPHRRLLHENFRSRRALWTSTKDSRFTQRVPTMRLTPTEIEETPMNQSASDTRDGFHLTRDHFTVPKDSSALDPKTKRAVTICNLFVNHKLDVGDIVRLLDEDRGRVVLALLELGIIHDRRNKPRPTRDGQERRKSSIVSLRTESH